jgi:putative YphP/YqiW family bacilliredoxin
MLAPSGGAGYIHRDFQLILTLFPLSSHQWGPRGPSEGGFFVPYDPVLVQPMREELTKIGAEELLTPEDVDTFMKEASGTRLLIVNSVCGCAAGMARPGVTIALQNEARPDRVATVFAGQDLEATERARSYFPDYPPSSPSFALFKNSDLVHFVPRHAIEGRDAQTVAFDLVAAFDRHCEPQKT